MKYFPRFLVAFLTFVFGVAMGGFSLADSFSSDPETFLEEIKDLQVQQTELNQELTFSSRRIGCGHDSFGNAASFTSSKASDGAVIHSTWIRGLKSERIASKRFNWEIKKADKIIEQGPYINYWKRKIGKKAIIEKDGRVSVIKYSKYSYGYSKYNEDFYIVILEAPSLRHALEFDRQEESLERSVYLNKLKP